MNSVNLIGNLTADPDLRKSDSGSSVVKLRVAVQRRRGKNGEDRGADFVDVTAFGEQADNCGRYLSKGRSVGIAGRLHHSEWDGEDGRRQRLEVIADNVEFLGARKTDEQTKEEGEQAPEPVAA